MLCINILCAIIYWLHNPIVPSASQKNANIYWKSYFTSKPSLALWVQSLATPTDSQEYFAAEKLLHFWTTRKTPSLIHEARRYMYKHWHFSIEVHTLTSTKVQIGSIFKNKLMECHPKDPCTKQLQALSNWLQSAYPHTWSSSSKGVVSTVQVRNSKFANRVQKKSITLLDCPWGVMLLGVHSL